MKHALTIGILLHVMTVCLTANEFEKTHRVTQLLEQMERQEAEQHHGNLHATMEFFGRRTPSPEYMELITIVSTDWKAILGNVEEIARTDVQQFILFSTVRLLPQKISFQCLDKLADLTSDKVVTKEIFCSILRTYDIYTKWALARNYKDPVVASALRKAKIINPEKMKYYNKITSGRAYREVTSPFFYDHNRNEDPNFFSLKSWFEFLTQPIALAIYAVITAIIIAIRRLVKRRRQRKE